MNDETQPITHSLTRRGFLKSVALGAVAVGAAGSGLTACSPAQNTKPADSNGATPPGGTGAFEPIPLNPQDYD